MKRKILFIINPISGSRKKTALPFLINRMISSEKFEKEIVFTNARGHATEMASKAVKAGFSTIVAVGGDGTVNEVAQSLIHTPVSLAILPEGSGNGLARHMKIPLNTLYALQLINTGTARIIDSCSVNDKPFFCTSGVGFDAHIGKLFAEKTSRGFSGYVSTSLNEFMKYKPVDYILSGKNIDINKQAFLVTFANSAQYGNNAFISPSASITDGLIDVCIMAPFPKYKVLDLGIRLFSKRIDKSPYLKIYQTNEVLVQREEDGAIHLDGEPFFMGKTLSVKNVPASLNILCPN